MVFSWRDQTSLNSLSLSVSPPWSHLCSLSLSVSPLSSLVSPLLSLSQEEDEVPDDETVNQMIARSEEEFEQFMVRTWPS